MSLPHRPAMSTGLGWACIMNPKPIPEHVQLYAMVGTIPHAIAYGMHCVVCIGIPYGHMIMSHDQMVTVDM